MSLIKSISGIRGTIGGRVGEGLNPVDSSFYSRLCRSTFGISQTVACRFQTDYSSGA